VSVKRKGLGLLGLSLLALALVSHGCRQQGSTSSGEEESANTTRLPIVSVMVLRYDTFVHYFGVQGRVKARKEVRVFPEMGGTIRSLPVREGQTVAKGQVLAALDDGILSKSIEEVQVQLEEARYWMKKQKKLYEEGAIAELQWRQARTRVESLEKTLARLEEQRKKFVVRAPFSGYVEEVYVVEGQLVGPTAPVALLLQPSDLYVEADVPETKIPYLHKGGKVNVYLPALRKKFSDLHLSKIGHMVHPTNRTVSVEVELPKGRDKIVPHMQAVLDIRDYYSDSAIVLPVSAVLMDFEHRPYVFVVDEQNIVHKRLVEPGLEYRGRYEIRKGLMPGEKVILRGARAVQEGMKVRIRQDEG